MNQSFLLLSNFLRSGRRTVLAVLNFFRMLIRARTESSNQDRTVIVLSLGSLGRSPEVARQAQVQGFYVHVFCNEFPLYEARYGHDWTRLDCRHDFDKALCVARKINPVAVLVESKNLLLPMQNYLAHELGLTAIGDLAAKSSNSKICLRQCLDKGNVSTLPWGTFDTVHESQIDFPVVVKPDLGTASKGVRFIESQSELDVMEDVMSQTRGDASVGDQWIYEGYVKGRQFDVEGLAAQGQYHVLTIVEEYYEAAPPHFPPAWFYFNPPISEEVSKALKSATGRALESLEVKHGSWHMEQRIDENGDVLIIDYANRMGYNQLVSSACGVSFSGEYVRSMTRSNYVLPELLPKAQLQLFAFDQDTVDSMKSLARSKPGNVHSKSFFPYEFSYHLYLGYIVINAENHADLVKLLDEFNLKPAQFDVYYK